MRRVERIRVERLRRAVVTAGCGFAVGALTALGLIWYDGGAREDPRYTQADTVGRVPNAEPAAVQPGEPQPTATAGRPRDELIAPDDRDLTMPVDGVDGDDLRDTFHETRAGTRPHEALDIMAPRGTPVRAVRDGHIEKLFTSDAGGLTIYQFEPTGAYAYYYAHLDRYAPGLIEGQQVARGKLIGFVGSTGNASPDAPHLHFAIYRLGPGRRWWEGLALNPYPLLK
jgi:murein DD-endopeptidase MepM/ murein hydrolase activator NlpD